MIKRQELYIKFHVSLVPEEKSEVMKSIMSACDSLEHGHKQMTNQTDSSAAYSALSMLQQGEDEMEDS